MSRGVPNGGKKHWTQRPGAKKKMARAAKKGHATRNGKSIAERAVAKELKRRPASKEKKEKPRRNNATVYFSDPDGHLQRDAHVFRTWGELFDILTNNYLGIGIDEVRVVCDGRM